jgi:hypothetical protein
MTRQLSRTDRACVDAMLNSPWPEEALTVDLGAEVLMTKGISRADAERIARGLYDERIKIHIGG